MIKNILPVILYAALLIAQIVFCALQNQKYRKITKMLLLPVLALSYLLNTELGIKKAVFVLAALLFGWIGDYILLKPNKDKNKRIGSTFFAIGHVVYIYVMATRIGTFCFELLPAIVAIASLALAAYSFYRLLPIIKDNFKTLSFAYFILLGIGIAFGFIGSIDKAFHVSCGIGYLFFLASDSILVHQWFTTGDPEPKHDVVVMATYGMAQLLIVIGLV